jgi:hypothetical protein
VQTYTVYEPRPAPEDVDERAAGLVFVKEGFSFYAFLVPPLWLAFHRLWIELAVYVAVSLAAGGLIALAGMPQETASLAALAINLVLGYEARDLYRRALERRGYVLRAVVSGRGQDECELRFFQDWLGGARADHARLAAIPNLTSPGGAAKHALKEPVIGMFPAHGG